MGVLPAGTFYSLFYITTINNVQGERLLPKNIQAKTKPTRHSQMFWGAFSFFRKSPLVPPYGHPDSPRGGVNAQRILETLKAQLPEVCDPGSIFIQDNASSIQRLSSKIG